VWESGLPDSRSRSLLITVADTCVQMTVFLVKVIRMVREAMGREGCYLSES
jgi:hypothetical protein